MAKYNQTSLRVEVDLDDLAEQLATSLEPDVLLHLITLIDENVSDLVFTQELRDKLNDVIRTEEAHDHREESLSWH